MAQLSDGISSPEKAADSASKHETSTCRWYLVRASGFDFADRLLVALMADYLGMQPILRPFLNLQTGVFLAALVILAIPVSFVMNRLKLWCYKGVGNLIFISYRNGDIVTDLKAELAARFGEGAVFLDDNKIAGGSRFPPQIDRALAECGIFLSVIGKVWLDKMPRLSEPADWVRREIISALKRNIHLVPIPIDGASTQSSLI